MKYDLLTLGEALLRLWVEPGTRLENAHQLRLDVAGAEANVAVAAARMGRSVAWLSRLPDTMLGRRVARELASQGVDVTHVRWSSEERMGVYFVELSVPPRSIRIVYDRRYSAASAMTAADVSPSLIESARILHLTGITPALSDTCRDTAFEAARRARAESTVVSFDVNYRPGLWPAHEARPVLVELCSLADLVIVTEEDARDVFRLSGEPSEVLAALSGLTDAAHLVLTQGGRGASWLSNGQLGTAPGYRVEALDRIGAGDAFAAGVLLGLLDGDVGSGVERGLAMAALAMGIFGDQFRFEPAEVEALTKGGEREVSR